MANTDDERTPLLQFPDTETYIAQQPGSGRYATSFLAPLQQQHAATPVFPPDPHNQFCHLVGVRPHNLPVDTTHKPHKESLYMRATRHRRNQAWTYAFTATLTNGLLLSQVVLGAALTALGASNSSRVLITVFGALNTVIAGLVAFLKSRGQPVRARMFRDDLDRVVDEIENSAVMWLGISRHAHGYDAIDTDDEVTVRSEVARLTRLYDRAVKTNTMNDPDMYAAGPNVDPGKAGLRSKGAVVAPGVSEAPAAAAVPAEQDSSPASKPPDPTPPAAVVEPAKSTESTAVPDQLDGGGDAKPAPSAERAGSSTATTPPKEDSPGPAQSTPESAKAEPAPSSTPAPASTPVPASTPAPAPVTAPPSDPDESPASAAHLVRRHSHKEDSDQLKDWDDPGNKPEASGGSEGTGGKDGDAQAGASGDGTA